MKSRADSWQLSISIDKCCILNIGKETPNTCLSISGISLPVYASTRDLGITISFDLSPTLHINDIHIVVKAHKRLKASPCYTAHIYFTRCWFAYSSLHCLRPVPSWI